MSRNHLDDADKAIEARSWCVTVVVVTVVFVALWWFAS